MELDQRHALVNGAPGVVTFRNGRPFSVMAFEVADDRIVAIDILADPERLAGLDLRAVA
jgi:RNA polymerase sigma-70 factor (ECF subfamily)